MATLTEQFAALNQTDLSGLQKRIDALREQAEADLKRATSTEKAATSSDISKAAQSAGMPIEYFMTALERAKKTGLI